MTAKVSRFDDGTPLRDGPKCPECPEGVPTLFPSQIGTSRRCPDAVGEGVPCVPVYKTGHRAPGAIRRRANLGKHTCGAWILTGLDADMCALTVYVEPYALTPHGEVEALRDHRTTYHLQQGALHPRTAYTIPGKPPSHARTILASHTCHHPIPDSWRLPPAPDTRRPQPSQEPPF